MATSKHLLALLRSHIDGDEDQFYSVALQVAANEAKQGHGRLAQELRQLVEAGRTTPKVYHDDKPALLAQPKGELGNIVAASYPDIRLSSMILDESIEESLRRILLENRQRVRLKQYGLNPRRKILFIGPPGSGKTMSASAIAGELKLPLMTVLLDGIITKFLGETASKLRVLFDAIAQSRAVYFFDEFDALGSKRSEKNDVGEIRRVLNSFLQFLEKDNGESIIIAATNHVELLDPALFRRFDDVIEYALPNEFVVQRIIEVRFATFRLEKLNWSTILKKAKGLSHAELVKACDDAAKNAVLKNRDVITQQDLLSALTERISACNRKI